MSERKVLNKYYPPDFDPAKIPKLKRPKDRQYVVRLMAPFNMRCKTCGEYIYKGKKFNARKETVQNELYLGLAIFRFYIKCTRCLAEITFKTDLKNTYYAMEHGATRNFQAEKLMEEEEKKIQIAREEEELNYPLKVLENRTRDSKLEMDVLENLQELKELNRRQAQVDFVSMLQQFREQEKKQKEKEQEEDERELQEILELKCYKRLRDSDSGSDQKQNSSKPCAAKKPTDLLILDLKVCGKDGTVIEVKRQKVESGERSMGMFRARTALQSLVVRKKPVAKVTAQQSAAGALNDANPSKTKATASCSQTPSARSGSSLGLLVAYSDSDQRDSN